jgi:hypothetical protein
MVDLRFLQERDGYGHYRWKVDVKLHYPMKTIGTWESRFFFGISLLIITLPCRRGHRGTLCACYADRLPSQLSFSSLSLASYVWLV